MATPSPRPDDPRPLDPREERILAEISRDLGEEAPEPGAGSAGARTPGPPARHDRFVAAIAVLVILAVVLPAPWFAGVLVIVVMGGPVMLAAALLPDSRPGPSRPDDDAG